MSKIIIELFGDRFLKRREDGSFTSVSRKEEATKFTKDEEETLLMERVNSRSTRYHGQVLVDGIIRKVKQSITIIDEQTMSKRIITTILTVLISPFLLIFYFVLLIVMPSWRNRKL